MALSLLAMKFVNIFKQAKVGFNDIEDFGICMFGLPDNLTAFFKSINLMRNRGKFFKLDDIFLKFKWTFNGDEETKMQNKFDNMCR